ncbi:MAG: hydrogenase maturation peptidase HycI [Candidatus Bathyarchaeia archaeon]
MSSSFRDYLENWLRGFSKLVIMGIGNILKGDDALGPEFVSELRGKLPKNVEVLDCGTVPENFIGKIIWLKPSHVLLVDAAHFGGRPGEMILIPSDHISGVASSTHNVPLNILAELIGKFSGAKVMLLGIEPKNLNLGDDMSPEIRESVKLGSRILIETINSILEEEKSES